MKLLTVAVPCYNSAAYMEHCLDTLLTGGEEMEILIVNDGSTKDNTAEIADRYQAAYPTIVKAIHKENGGHGSGVNAGVQHAAGMYFKVVDSDDWVNTDVLPQILAKLREFAASPEPVDMLISNYTYEHAEDGTSRTLKYTGRLPENCIFGWDEVGHFRPDQHILMHSVIYRTQLLRDSKTELLHHCFYVDNIFVYQPLPFVKTMYYMDVNFYCYFIGREDQSVNEENFIRQVDQQLRVIYRLLEVCNPMTLEGPRRLRNYMLHYLSMMILIASVFLTLGKTEENEAKRRKLWMDIHAMDEKLYRQLRYRSLCGFASMPVVRKRQILGNGYRLARKIYKFN
ncbi:MAG: glycosyltransferase family 2 protein [Oscillospiraceae bacterium]|nr:glycosyltransferase family 2 protein [Oscillospiraceae bacterium]